MTEMNKVKPGWLRTGALVSAVLPEAPVIQKYRGGSASEIDSRYESALSEAALDGMVSAGVTVLWFHFFSGLGLEFEKSEMERSRTLIGAAHTRGLKVAAIVQFGAATTETLLLEESECQNWLQVNSEGQHPAVEDAAFFRVRPCFNSESFLRYMERVCSTAVEFGADLIHLENAAFNPEPDTCRCPICVGSYRDFLRQKYGAQDEKTRQAGMQRFGHSAFAHVRPPVFPRSAGNLERQAAQSPHVQEWSLFKAQRMGSCLARLTRGISKRNPECAVSADLLRHFSPGSGSEAAHGIQFEQHVPLLDVVTARLPQDGIELTFSNEEHLKIARLFGVAAQTQPGRTASIEGQAQPYTLFELTF